MWLLNPLTTYSPITIKPNTFTNQCLSPFLFNLPWPIFPLTHSQTIHSVKIGPISGQWSIAHQLNDKIRIMPLTLLEPESLRLRHKQVKSHSHLDLNPCTLWTHLLLQMKPTFLTMVPKCELCSSPILGADDAQKKIIINKSAFLADTSYVPHTLHIPLHTRMFWGREFSNRF